MANSPGRSPNGGQPTVDDAIQQAHEMVEDGLYHNAESLLDTLLTSAPLHPDIDDEDMETLEQKHNAFQSALEGRYVNSGDLTELLDEINAVFDE